MANLNDHSSRFRKGLSNPFSTFGEDWCPRCKAVTDCDTQAQHVDRTYAYKRTCNRCGRVTSRGVFDNVPLLSRPLPPAALEWTMAPGVDRR